MSDIILIRKFDQPTGVDYLEQASSALAWCRKLYGVSPRLHFLAEDGLRFACHFDAPDAEAVRNVLRAGTRSEPEALWPCSVHPGPEDDGDTDPLQAGATGTLVVVERAFEHPARADDLHPNGARPADRHDVRLLRSYLSGNRLRAICVYVAPDLESVRQIHGAAGLAFERIWSARAIDGASCEAPADAS
jgi:hypothetical protein